jgi:hypothetical protein
MPGGLPSPTTKRITLVQATSPCHLEMLSPTISSTTLSTPSLYPFAFGTMGIMNYEGGAAHPFCVGALTPPPWKRTRCKRQPHCVGQHHDPQAPNPQEHLLCRRGHQPCAPNLSLVMDGLKQGDSVASSSFGGTFCKTIFLVEGYLLFVFHFWFISVDC